MSTQPDLFTNVHKGIRRALFETCIALGRAGDDQPRAAAARAMLGEVLHFVAHHGENEDLLLLPLLERRAPEVFERIHTDHARVGEALEALRASIDTAAIADLYRRTCDFVGLYLEHLRDEESLEPRIRAALELDELIGFGRGSVERTAPADQRMMLGWMLPAMTRVDVEAFISRVPAGLAAELRSLVEGAG
jgi:hypothetical protein